MKLCTYIVITLLLICGAAIADDSTQNLRVDVVTHKIVIPLGATVDFNVPGLTLLGIPVTPSGTGFVHVVSGTQDSAAKLVANADVDPAASIAQSKLNLNGNIPAGWLGTSSTTAAAGDDSRLSDTRTPTDGSVTDAKVASNAAIAESKLNLATDAAANVGSRRTLGTGALQAAAGNDSRLSDTRTPTDGTVTTAKIVDKNVTYGKIQDVTAQKLLGRYTNSNGSAQEITIGTGLSLDTSTGELATTAGGGNVNGTGLTNNNVIIGAGSSSIQDSGVAIAQLEASYQTATVSTAGNTNSNISGQLHAVKVTASAGSGSYTATYSIPTSGRVAGDREEFHLSFAASSNPTVEIHNATSGGTLLFTWTGDGDATEIAGDCVFNGSAWVLSDAHFVW